MLMSNGGAPWRVAMVPRSLKPGRLVGVGVSRLGEYGGVDVGDDADDDTTAAKVVPVCSTHTLEVYP